MYELEDRKFLEDIKTDILSRLEDYSETRHSAGDIGYLVTESENANGSWYCNAYKAEQDVKNHWDVFGGVYAYMKVELGYEMNPFTETEKFHDVAMINLYDLTYQRMLSEAGIDSNTMIEINDDFIDALRKNMDKVDIGDTLEWYEDRSRE